MNLPLVAGLILVAIIALAVLLGGGASQRKVKGLRAQGVYPEQGKESIEDVRRLIRSGEKILAIRCYRALHHVGLKEAKDAVDAMERDGH